MGAAKFYKVEIEKPTLKKAYNTCENILKKTTADCDAPRIVLKITDLNVLPRILPIIKDFSVRIAFVTKDFDWLFQILNEEVKNIGSCGISNKSLDSRKGFYYSFYIRTQKGPFRNEMTITLHVSSYLEVEAREKHNEDKAKLREVIRALSNVEFPMYGWRYPKSEKDIKNFVDLMYDLNIGDKNLDGSWSYGAPEFGMGPSGFCIDKKDRKVPCEFRINVNRVYPDLLKRVNEQFKLFMPKPLKESYEYNVNLDLPASLLHKFISSHTSNIEIYIERKNVDEKFVKTLLEIFEKERTNTFTLYWRDINWLNTGRPGYNEIELFANTHHSSMAIKDNIKINIAINTRLETDKLVKEIEKKTGLKLQYLFME